ncbi:MULTISPECIES: glycine zipper 2TM domain-containing protein [Halomonas]|uniref:Glycine zipper 2TM domain-containing protein n=1 Tax=Halomonas litopenaei TaxID=2109328 RepID=A0ABX5IXC7_9GAMM|nr:MULTISPECIES: glycine zipper 2TM domain-containing protein [Halomonas]KJZ14065.1 membrane protein [Halomonas sp. S2151]MCJ8287157.1 glycine zipper 2TM domain-containing protein [Halomonas sp.]MCO7214197.1 glycine zipper 2TM domain-containing protein [Halomonas sp. OfavH-34-E]NQY71872.1 glycine zipper 2TM domain-containing protein [Halomonas sp.]PTL89970.1 glycine zipper 2TM domain-containing protein [Halomonas sp. SYSU XM8]
MKTSILPVLALSVVVLGGCTATNQYSGNVYSGNQAQTAQNVQFGTITALRRVQIQGESSAGGILGTGGGAVIGGLLGNQVGGGSGRTIATAAGAIGGAVAGNQIEKGVNRTDAWEMEIRKDSGQTVVVVQKADQAFQVGQRVRLIGSGSRQSVAPY